MSEEIKKAMLDAKKFGVGLYDTTIKKRIDINNLTFITEPYKVLKKLKPEVQLRASLIAIQKIQEEKFPNQSPYDLELFKKDEGLFVERLIRAVEICTLKYALNIESSALNINKKSSVIKGRTRFLWED